MGNTDISIGEVAEIGYELRRNNYEINRVFGTLDRLNLSKGFFEKMYQIITASACTSVVYTYIAGITVFPMETLTDDQKW